MTILTTFQLALARIEQVGCHRSVQFSTLASAPLNSASPRAGSLEGGRVGHSPTRRYVTAKNQKRRSPAFFQQAKAQLDLLSMEKES